MRLLKRLCDALRKKITVKNLADVNPSVALARDLGVVITRIRLPSGAEIVIVERINDSE